MKKQRYREGYVQDGTCVWKWAPGLQYGPERLRGVFTTRRYTNTRLHYLTLPFNDFEVGGRLEP